ncbi:hypothetical protein ACP4OV_026304 [Aristida adscensionis]
MVREISRQNPTGASITKGPPTVVPSADRFSAASSPRPRRRLSPGRAQDSNSGDLEEKYEKLLKDARDGELKCAMKAEILEKELKNEQCKYAAFAELLIKAEQLLDEQQSKDDELTEKLERVKKSHINRIAEENQHVNDQKILEDTRARELTHARRAAQLGMALKAERSKYASAIRELLRKTQQNLNKEVERKTLKLTVPPDRDKGVDNVSGVLEVENELEVEELRRLRNAVKESGFDIESAIAKCQDIFLNPSEGSCTKLTDLLDGRIYIVPAKRNKEGPKSDLEKMSAFGKFVMAGIIECVYRLHRNDLCLYGKFSLDHLYVTVNKKIKLDLGGMKDSICYRSRDGINLDYFTIHGITDQILSIYDDSRPVPFDLKYLLGLLRCPEPFEKEDLIRYNASLMDEVQKKNHFLALYARMEQLDKEDKVKHGQRKEMYRSFKVLQFVKAAHENEWKENLHDNEFTKYNCDRHAVDVGWPSQSAGAKDMLETWRHNFTHLHEVSTKITDDDEADLLDYAAPGVINEFQEGMHSIGELELLHLMRTMRV